MVHALQVRSELVRVPGAQVVHEQSAVGAVSLAEPARQDCLAQGAANRQEVRGDGYGSPPETHELTEYFLPPVGFSYPLDFPSIERRTTGARSHNGCSVYGAGGAEDGRLKLFHKSSWTSWLGEIPRSAAKATISSRMDA